ncbi:MAG TPA: DUF2071 domain-containing protein [Candidatus Acidoferrales bacterium]|nr:DUF2071 domain-containing protein [Candidatus Acidoferrales bacterium]
MFLRAEWRDLVMLNYEVDPALLAKYVPRGTELDAHRGKTYVSLVGFQFLRTRMFGFLPIPFHTNFDEVNLRFYVRRREGQAVKRGVVFIREIVPRRAIVMVARRAYGENYTYRPMRHIVRRDAETIEARYEWRSGGKWGGLRVEAEGDAKLPVGGSAEQFITEHYWGYAAQPDDGCVEYEVKHEPWRVWNCTSAAFDGGAADLYGEALASVVLREPDSSFLAEGSEVQVLAGASLPR